jgi:hypothetical protein
MRIVYVAFDGTEFNREEECREYEETLKSTFVMWNREALVTTNPDFAVFVLLKSEGAGAAFIKACEAQGTYSAGIQEGDIGFFYWDEWNDEYRYLEKPLLDAIETILHNLH